LRDADELEKKKRSSLENSDTRKSLVRGKSLDNENTGSSSNNTSSAKIFPIGEKLKMIMPKDSNIKDSLFVPETNLETELHLHDTPDSISSMSLLLLFCVILIS
jgi:hypothetical protein